jgi:hypothetical protein
VDSYKWGNFEMYEIFKRIFMVKISEGARQEPPKRWYLTG